MSLHILRVSVWTEARQIVEQVAKLEMVNVQIKEKVNIEDDTSLNILLDKKLFYLIHCILDWPMTVKANLFSMIDLLFFYCDHSTNFYIGNSQTWFIKIL